MQNRGNFIVRLKHKLKKISRLNTIFTTRKKTCLPSLQSKFDKISKSLVADEIYCNGCESTYVGQTFRHLSTRIKEHQKIHSPLGQHVSDHCVLSKTFNWRILDQFSDTEKRICVDALHTRQQEPKTNTRD